MSATPSATRRTARFYAASRICAATVVALGLVVLAGWAFDVSAFEPVMPGMPMMTANAALLFVLFGVALLIAEDPTRRALRTSLGLLITTVAALTLLEYALSIDLGIDELLVRDAESRPPRVPGRMAVATAVTFLLFGLAVVAFDTPAVSPLRRGALLVASAVAFVSVCSYLFVVHSLYSAAPYTTGGLHTAVGFLLAATAYALSPSQRLVEVLASETVAGRLLRTLLPITLIVPVLVGRVMLEWARVGPYSVEFGVSIVVLSIVLSLGSVGWIAGHRLYRAEVAEQHAFDERSQLVAELRGMTQELEQRVEARTRDLREREGRYCALFEESPVALLEMDYSNALTFLRDAAPAEQIGERLMAQPELVETAATKVRIVDANRRGLELFGVEALPELTARWLETLGPKSYKTFGNLLLALLDGQSHFEIETTQDTLDGRSLHVRMHLTALPDASPARVIVSMIDIAASKEAERQLQEAVDRQEVLLREVHHRVKNNLAVIASLFYLASTHTTDAKAVALLEDSRRRIRSMALVHESLYRSDNFASIDMAEYTRSLANEVMSAFRPLTGNVQLSTDLQPVSLSVDVAVPCGLILNELVSNAFKHAFPDGRSGVVHVTLRESEAHCVICVTDDGVGLPADSSVANDHSLGLRLVHLLTKQLQGVVEFERRSAGTRACVTFDAQLKDRRSDEH